MEFGVDRSAVRNALRLLEENGLVVREHGRRPYVRYDAPAKMDTQRAAPSEQAVKTIAAIIPQHPLYPASLALLHGISTSLRSNEAPYRLQVIDTHGRNKAEEAVLENRALDSVLEERIAGIILWHKGDAESVRRIKGLQAQGIPVVMVDRYPADSPGDFVGVDNRAGIEDAIAHLRSWGHSKIGYVTTDEQTTAVQERLLAYRECMAENGSAPHPGWIFQLPQDNPIELKPAVDRFMSLNDKPTAICAMNDSLAHYFIAEVETHGLSVPDDLSVIGFDDLERYSPRPALLTTMHQPFDKIGRRAADLLINRLRQNGGTPPPHRHILLPTPLVVRATCRSPKAQPET